jgi:hypothetical protein
MKATHFHNGKKVNGDFQKDVVITKKQIMIAQYVNSVKKRAIIQKLLENIQNIIPYEEIFTGSNYKSYKHKYFVMYMSHKNSLCENNYEKAEVSKMEWKSYEDCISSIRHYNIEKKRVLSKIYDCLSQNIII